jgi:hypothetical protein
MLRTDHAYTNYSYTDHPHADYAYTDHTDYPHADHAYTDHPYTDHPHADHTDYPHARHTHHTPSAIRTSVHGAGDNDGRGTRRTATTGATLSPRCPGAGGNGP